MPRKFKLACEEKKRFIGPVRDESYTIALMHELCAHCRALRFKNERRNCCHNGKVKLDLTDFQNYPQELKHLLTGKNLPAQNFRRIIRQYNSAMAFASFGAHVSTLHGRGPSTFRIHGQIYHRTGSLHPAEGEAPTYSQLYIIEGSEATRYRLERPENNVCRQDTIELLTNVINRLSPYARAYQHMYEVEQTAIQQTGEGTDPPTITMYFKQGRDQRRYNEPHHDEVAVVFVGDDGAPPANRDIVVHPKDENPRQISYLSANIDPMVYPIFFPRRQLGWEYGTSHNPTFATPKRNTVTMLQFYSYRLSIRTQFSPLFYGEKLFQQYIVDSYVRTEASRLDFVKKNQTNLRAELYQGLMDHIQDEAQVQNLQPGRIVILPSSFQGSPRAMQQNFQDAMAIIGKYGKPDIFLTFTCNPKHQDIQNNLPEGHKVEHRPDLVARVFKLHLKELLDDITKKNVLGSVIAHVYVIEFQKRGLPHCHLLIVLADDCKIRLPEDIDSIISAEIPDVASNPELHNIIKTCMIHGPCGALRPFSVCMENGVCTKNYPKEFNEETRLRFDGYPLYRRRENDRTITVGQYELDNRWVVPYNPYLSRKYGAHINVEACTTVKSVKYLFKYIYKGHDCATLAVTSADQLNHDEVSAFVDTRYLSAPEGCWRLFEHEMHHQSHTIVRLPVHLPNQQLIYFREGQHEAAAINAAQKDTMLTAYFKLNVDHTTRLKYTDIPVQYIWKPQQREWVPRKRGGDKVIARMYFISPNNIELYCLRLLLLSTVGATSYEDLRTIDGVLEPTFKDACLRAHLLESDDEWDKSLQEASQFQMPSQLRSLFATICLQCNPSDPLYLWQKYREALSEDFLRNHAVQLDVAEQFALRHLRSIIENNNGNYEQLQLPEIHIENKDFDSTTLTHPRDVDEMIASLNHEQRIFVDEIAAAIKAVHNHQTEQAHLYFIQGPGGSGKTFVYNTLLAYCLSIGVKSAASAWTGIAATLLTNGRTTHNLFKLPVPITDTCSSNVSPTSKHLEALRTTSLFIVDEASMVPEHALNAIDKLLQDVCGNESTFWCEGIHFGRRFLSNSASNT